MQGCAFNPRILFPPVGFAFAITVLVGCIRLTETEGDSIGGRLKDSDTTANGVRDQQRVQALSILHPRAGRTGADDVRRWLGPPDYTTEDGLFWAYFVEMAHAPAGWEIYSGDKPKGYTYSELRRQLVVMQFDPAGVLQRRKSVRVPDSCVPSEHFMIISRRWAQRDADARVATGPSGS